VSEAASLPPEPPRPGVPPGFLAVAGLLFLWAAGYLFFFSAGFRGEILDETTGLYGPPDAPAETGPVDPVVLGQRLFVHNCAICHQTDGQGLRNQYPPLAGSEIVLGQAGYHEGHLVRIVLNGLVEPVTVRGASYNGSMVPWRAILSDAEAAALLTYLRQAWGNQAAPISPAVVAAIRAEVAGRNGPWTVGQLKQVPPSPAAPLLKTANP